MLNYREATLQDLNKLKEFEQRVIEAERPFNYSIKSSDAHYYDIPDLIARSNSMLLIAEDGMDLVATGYVQIRQSKPHLTHTQHGYLGFMFVSPEYRGQGINKVILDKLMNWGNTKGISDFYLDVYSSNQSAIKAYEKAGFRPSMLEMKLNANERT